MNETPVTPLRAAAPRLEELDVLRWAAILGVVFIHVSALAIRPATAVCSRARTG
jgi:peptidoglycan/LPS O-acetylase OafA/YrhL